MTIKNPDIRFKGFTDAWEQRKLGELSADFEYGLNASAASYDGTNKYIRITDISEGDRLFIQDNITSPSIDISEADKYLLKKGDILFARTGASVGKSYRYQESDGKVYYAGFLIRARIDTSYDVEFAFQNTLTNNYKRFVEITSQRSGQPGINAKEYADFKLQVPKLQEQKVIGEFFKLLDNTIALHQHELTLLKQRKKAFLQKMFPKKDKYIPEIRFQGFNNEWNKLKLKDFVEYKSSKYSSNQFGAENQEGNYPIFDANKIIAKISIYDMENEYISIIKDGAGVGRLCLRPNKTSVIGTMGYLFSNESDIYFIYSLLQKISFIKFVVGSTIPHIYFKDYGNIKLRIPSAEEQARIGKFFKQLDDSITLHEQKLELLKQMKKAFLQKMFV